MNKRRKTYEQAQLVAKQVEERAKRQIKLLEKAFELEKQKITEEVLIAREDVERVEFDNYLDKAYHIIKKKVMLFLNTKLGQG